MPTNEFKKINKRTKDDTILDMINQRDREEVHFDTSRPATTKKVFEVFKSYTPEDTVKVDPFGKMIIQAKETIWYIGTIKKDGNKREGRTSGKHADYFKGE